MKNILIVLFFGTLPLLGQVPAVTSSVNGENARRAREEYSSILHDPRRDPWQMPDAVVQSLAIKPTENILEIGADEGGYFSNRLARFAQNVYVLNPSAVALQTFQKEKPGNEQTQQGPPDDLGFNFRVDTIFIYNSLSSFSSRSAYFALASAIVGPQGRIVVIDFFKNTPPPGTPAAQKITSADVVADMKTAGLRLTGEFTYLPFQFFLVFQR
jgi:hypothetical protein